MEFDAVRSGELLPCLIVARLYGAFGAVNDVLPLVLQMDTKGRSAPTRVRRAARCLRSFPSTERALDDWYQASAHNTS